MHSILTFQCSAGCKFTLLRIFFLVWGMKLHIKFILVSVPPGPYLFSFFILLLALYNDLLSFFSPTIRYLYCPDNAATCLPFLFLSPGPYPFYLFYIAVLYNWLLRFFPIVTIISNILFVLLYIFLSLGLICSTFSTLLSFGWLFFLFPFRIHYL